MTPQEMLTQAGKNYGKCCRLVTANASNPDQPTAIESERLIGFGIASDWVRRAGALKPLEYNRRLLSRSNRSPGVTELIRFNLAWSGMNALFCRKSICDLLSTSSARGELARFKIFVRNANLSAQDVAIAERNLRNILDTQISTRIPGVPLGTPVTTLMALHSKYTPPDAQNRGASRTVGDALAAGSLAQLDLSTVIYLMRNWALHGALIDSSFRSVARFRSFIGIILANTAAIHHGVSNALLAKLYPCANKSLQGTFDPSPTLLPQNGLRLKRPRS